MPDPSRFDFVKKLALFPERAAAVRERELERAISTVYLDVNTGICNHACTFCDGFYRPLVPMHLPWPRLSRLVDEMEELGVLGVVLAGDGGEPLLHPQIDLLLAKLARTSIRFGIYTNGTRIPDPILQSLGEATFVRISADAASAGTHRKLHVYAERRSDFEVLVRNVERLAPLVPDLGISFVLDPSNHLEIESAADIFLGAGARFLELKPIYGRGYTLDLAALAPLVEAIRRQVLAARSKWKERVVLNNQIESLLGGEAPAPLRVAPRRCLTSALRLVVSSHGCYTCTPFRGEAERAVGDILTQSLREVVASARRRALLDHPCDRLCAYDRQNDALLAQDDGRLEPRPVDGAAAPSGQDFFL
jgi:MoaA/NifB/PqqE/SkfB family radical SAM enzyme